MKLILTILPVFFTLTITLPQRQNFVNPRDTYLLRYINNNNGRGKYYFEFETSDGTVRKESGNLQYPGTDYEALSVNGTFRFISTDGQEYVVNYLADENGFQPQGAHIPRYNDIIRTPIITPRRRNKYKRR